MAAMTKRVNINAPVAIRTITPPIYGTCKNIIMSTGDILKCLCKRAIVDEILPDGSTVRLTMKNYYTDNGAGLDASKVTPIIAEEPNPVEVDTTDKVVEIVPEVDSTNNDVNFEPLPEIDNNSEEIEEKVCEPVVNEVVETTEVNESENTTTAEEEQPCEVKKTNTTKKKTTTSSKKKTNAVKEETEK